MNRVVKLLATFILASVLSLLSTLPVHAIIGPDVGPVIDRVDVFRHCLEADDMLVLVRYHLDYNIDPPETINQAYIGTFMDGIVEMARVSPYTFYDKSYNHGVFSMYLSADDAPAWNGVYTVTFEGNPILDWQGLGAASAMFGAVADDGGVQTDETAAANSAVANDMTLLPANPIACDAYYFGEDTPFDKLTLNIGTQGGGTQLLIWEYWDGGDWSSLSNVVDSTESFTASAGNRNLTFTEPVGWSLTTVSAINAYWIRARLYSYTDDVVAMAGAVADDGALLTDETVAANNDTPSDMTLLPLLPVANDAYYFSSDKPFSKLTLDIGTQGDGNWAVTWEYWNGAWVALPGAVDDTDSFRAAIGNRDVTFPAPADWIETTIDAIPGYWIRANLSAFVGIVIQPFGTQSWTNVAPAKGTQCWTNVTAPPPYTSETVFTWHSTVNDAVTRMLLGTNIIAVATSLSDYWGYVLTEETAAGMILSSYGEQYFGNVIPNLRDMTQGAFSGAVQAPIYEEVVEAATYRDTLLSRWAGTMTGTAFAGLAAWTTLPLVMVKGLIWLVITGLVAYFMSISVKDMRYAMFLTILMMPLGNLLGMLSLTFTIVGTLLCILALGYALFYQRSAG